MGDFVKTIRDFFGERVRRRPEGFDERLIGIKYV